jgi:hypothetical protein
MPVLSLTAAARLAGVDRQTIRRAIQSGRISATSGSDGNRGVELSELLRVYPHASAQGAPRAPSGEMSQSAQGPRPGSAQAEIDALQRELELLRRQLDAALEREQRLLGIIEQRLLPAPKKPLLERWAEVWQRGTKK